MLGLAFLLAAVTVSDAEGGARPLRSTTIKPLDEFAGCFAAQQERNGRRWAFLATHTGGIFTNASGDASPGEFWLRISGDTGSRRLLLIADPRAPSDIAVAMNRCR